MLKKITPLNGFDETNLDSARQNHYPWSMEELDDYIYVGTGRNVLLGLFSSFLNVDPPFDLRPNKLDMTAEIWRYKKDGTRKWERVFKTKEEDGISGFRFMHNFNSFGLQPALYACSFGERFKIYKSTNGVNWFQLDSTNLQGTSSRAMTSNDGKIYLATVDDSFGPEALNCYIYSSTDPEVYGWTLETPSSDDLDPKTNIQGAAYCMEFFNDHLYVATIQADGVSIWRTVGSKPQKDGWKLVFDKSGGDAANVGSASMGIFNDYLYFGTGSNGINFGTSGSVGKGAEVFRIDVNDNWELVVGGDPVEPTEPTTGTRGPALSGYGSGFNIPYNCYMWQIKAYKGQLLITTLDLSSLIQPLLKTFVKNRDYFIESSIYPKETIDQIIDAFEQQVKLLASLKYPVGFDMYTSYNGTRFSPFTLNGVGTLSGFGNPYNYGGRMLFESSEGVLYIGTANPFQGCEVWEYSRPSYSRFF